MKGTEWLWTGLFVATLVVHGLSWVPGFLFPLGFLVIVIFFAATSAGMFAALGICAWEWDRLTAKQGWEKWLGGGPLSLSFQFRILSLVPTSFYLFCAVVVGGAIFVVLQGDHTFHVRTRGSGVYQLLDDDGEVIRELTEREFREYLKLVIRFFSCFWLMSTLVPMGYFQHIHPRLRGMK